MLNEPDVALTDFLLTAEAMVFFILLRRYRPDGSAGPLCRAAGAFWLTLAVAALLGGLFHGFSPRLPAATYILLWKAVMLMVGWNNVYLFHLALGFWSWQCGESRRIPLIKALVWGLYLLYAAIILGVSSCYTMAIAFNLPAICAMVAVLGWLIFRPGAREVASKGLVGMALTVLAALLQLLKVDWPAMGLTYNAVYHLLTGLGLLFLYHAARLAISAPPPPTAMPAEPDA